MDSIWSRNGVPSVAIAIYFAFAFVAARFLLNVFIYQVSFLFFIFFTLLLWGWGGLRFNPLLSLNLLVWLKNLDYKRDVSSLVVDYDYPKTWFLL